MNFLTAEYCTLRSKQQLVNKLKAILNQYVTRGFEITAIHGDNEFNVKDIKDFLLPIITHIYGKGEHMCMIERPIKVIKERSRCICSALPYHYDTELMMVTLIKVVIRWLDAFPSKNSISNNLSPSMIVEGKK